MPIGGRNVADESLRFHDSNVGLLVDGEQIVRNVTLDVSGVSPVIRDSDLMDGSAIDAQGFQATSDKNTSFHAGSRGGDDRVLAVHQSSFGRQFGRNFGEEFRLQ